MDEEGGAPGCCWPRELGRLWGCCRRLCGYRTSGEAKEGRSVRLGAEIGEERRWGFGDESHGSRMEKMWGSYELERRDRLGLGLGLRRKLYIGKWCYEFGLIG